MLFIASLLFILEGLLTSAPSLFAPNLRAHNNLCVQFPTLSGSKQITNFNTLTFIIWGGFLNTGIVIIFAVSIRSIAQSAKRSGRKVNSGLKVIARSLALCLNNILCFMLQITIQILLSYNYDIHDAVAQEWLLFFFLPLFSIAQPITMTFSSRSFSRTKFRIWKEIKLLYPKHLHWWNLSSHSWWTQGSNIDGIIM